MRSIAARVWLRISVGVLAEPSPGAGNDLLQIWKLWPPSKLLLNFFGACDQHCGIAGAAMSLNGRDSVAGHPARSLDDFANGEAAAVAEIKDQLRLLFQCFERQHVRDREVRNMDVIANAGAVACWVARPKDRDVLALAQCNREHQRNQVCLRVMHLAQSFGRTGGVEVAQAGVAQSMNACEPREHALDEQLRFAINVGGPQRVGLAN